MTPPLRNTRNTTSSTCSSDSCTLERKTKCLEQLIPPRPAARREQVVERPPPPLGCELACLHSALPTHSAPAPRQDQDWSTDARFDRRHLHDFRNVPKNCNLNPLKSFETNPLNRKFANSRLKSVRMLSNDFFFLWESQTLQWLQLGSSGKVCNQEWWPHWASWSSIY